MIETTKGKEEPPSTTLFGGPSSSVAAPPPLLLLAQRDEDNELLVPKSCRGLVPGGPIPGAYEIRGRARGEVPFWVGAYSSHNSLSSSPRSEVLQHSSSTIQDTDLVEQQNDDVVVVVVEDTSLAPGDKPSIEAVKATTDHDHDDVLPRRFCLLAGWLLITSLIVSLYIHFTKNTTRNNPHEGGGQGADDQQEPSFNKTRRKNVVNLTIAQAILTDEDNFFLKTVAGELFLEELNRTDVNVTFFGIKEGANLLEGVDPLLISKMISSLWTGHVLDGFEGLLVEGVALDVEDMYNGMVLTSVAGYPLEIQVTPEFRVNNVTIVTTENIHFKNGIYHGFIRYPNPLVPWIGKSLFQVLLETNDRRNGDLSSFLALLEASPARDLKDLLQEQGSRKATTIFVPTNEALSRLLDPALLADPTFLLNHVVTGNFARRCWRTIPTGTKLSDTELRLESQAGKILDLKINRLDSVSINGEVTIIQQDIFSEDGIVHVIDGPLL